MGLLFTYTSRELVVIMGHGLVNHFVTHPPPPKKKYTFLQCLDSTKAEHTSYPTQYIRHKFKPEYTPELKEKRKNQTS